MDDQHWEHSIFGRVLLLLGCALWFFGLIIWLPISTIYRALTQSRSGSNRRK